MAIALALQAGFLNYAVAELELIQKIEAPADSEGGGFGHSIAISDGTIVVGDPTFDGGKGRVVVYSRSNGQWHHEKTIYPFTVGAQTFGHSVAISGSTMVIGAPESDRQGTPRDRPISNAGLVSIYDRDPRSGSWEGDATYYSTVDDERYGYHVQVEQVADATNFLIGVPGAGGERGRIATLTRIETGAFLSAGNGQLNGSHPGGRMGEIFLIGDNGLVVGLPRADRTKNIGHSPVPIPCEEAGGAKVFDREVKEQFLSWVETDDILDGMPAGNSFGSFDHFGQSLAFANGILAVGTPQKKSSMSHSQLPSEASQWPTSGAVYVFREGIDGAFDFETRIARAPEAFGRALGVLNNQLVVGAQGEVQVFDLNPNPQRLHSETPVQTLVSDELSAAFGSSIAVDGRDLVVAQRGSRGAPGAVYIYEKKLPEVVGHLAWTEQFVIPELFSGDFDTDDDGASDLMEYAGGSNPTLGSNSPSPPQLSRLPDGGTMLKIRVAHPLPSDIDIVVESSDGLGEWSEVADIGAMRARESQTEIVPGTPSGGIRDVVVYDRGESSSKFFRTRVALREFPRRQ